MRMPRARSRRTADDGARSRRRRSRPIAVDVDVASCARSPRSSSRHELTELERRTEDAARLTVRRGGARGVAALAGRMRRTPAHAAGRAIRRTAPPPRRRGAARRHGARRRRRPDAAETATSPYVTSPFVGTFYRSP